MIASSNPNSKIAPVIDEYADCEPRSSACQACRPPGSYSMKRSVFGSFVEKPIELSVPSISITHVFVSPGAIRFVSIRNGKLTPLSRASQRRTALSHVSQRARPPLPSGRSVKTSDRIA